jgi:hypothetical protein
MRGSQKSRILSGIPTTKCGGFEIVNFGPFSSQISTTIRSKTVPHFCPALELKRNVDVSCQGRVFDSLSKEFRRNCIVRLVLFLRHNLRSDQE